jgi:hypothetical protein
LGDKQCSFRPKIIRQDSLNKMTVVKGAKIIE